jgi:hypothetical protein
MEKKPMFLAMDPEKVIDKIQHPFKKNLSADRRG